MSRARFLTLVAVLSLALAGLGWKATAAPHPAAAQTVNNASQACSQFVEQDIHDFFFYVVGANVTVSPGACVALLESGNATPLAVSFCKSADVAPYFQNQGQCLQEIKPFLQSFLTGP